MLKEIILAIIIGSLLGFGLMGGYLAINKKSDNNENPPVVTTPTSIPNDNQEPSQQKDIIIESIDDYDIVDKDNLKLTGKTNPNSTIVVILNDKVFDDSSNDQGEFTFDIPLESGLNIINITAIDEQDNQFEKELHITYSTAKI